MVIRTFIVNLRDDVVRRKHINDILAIYKDSLDIEFIEAVDGRILSEEQRRGKFNVEKFETNFFRKIMPGEIGCTLSHQNIYKKIIEEKIHIALILEDDIIIRENLSPLLPDIEKKLESNVPMIILLSGWFWYTKKQKFDKSHDLAKVVDGYLTHSYAINYAAAKLMHTDYPYLLADSWEKYMDNGIKIYGITPHLIDQDWTNFQSTITGSQTRGLGLKNLQQWFNVKRRTIKQHMLEIFGLYESKSRV